MTFFALNICVHFGYFLKKNFNKWNYLGPRVGWACFGGFQYVLPTCPSQRRYGFTLLREYKCVHFAVVLSILGISTEKLIIKSQHHLNLHFLASWCSCISFLYLLTDISQIDFCVLGLQNFQLSGVNLLLLSFILLKVRTSYIIGSWNFDRTIPCFILSIIDDFTQTGELSVTQSPTSSVWQSELRFLGLSRHRISRVYCVLNHYRYISLVNGISRIYIW